MKALMDLVSGAGPMVMVAAEALGVFVVYGVGILCAVVFDRWYGPRLRQGGRIELRKIRTRMGWMKPRPADLTPVWKFWRVSRAPESREK